MNVLIAGNSQAGALYRAAQAGIPSDLGDVTFHFYIIQGGPGPYFRVDGDHLAVTNFNEKFPPYEMPDTVDTQPLSSFDAIVVSALGYVDGGFYYLNPIVDQGVVAEFGLTEAAAGKPLISLATWRAVVRHGLLRQPGYQFLKELAGSYQGRTLVQPFPYISDEMPEHDDWKMGAFYADSKAANRFLADARDVANAEICKELGVELLDTPDPAFRAAGFTPRHLMRPSDGLHVEQEYGGMVLAQIATAL